MDAYQRFKVVIHRWLRFIGICLGHDILRDEFKPNLYTTFIALVSIAFPCLNLLTILYFDGDLAIKSGGLLAMSTKVGRMKILYITANYTALRKHDNLCRDGRTQIPFKIWFSSFYFLDTIFRIWLYLIGHAVNYLFLLFRFRRCYKYLYNTHPVSLGWGLGRP